jgi:hypothetical protein
VSGPSKLSGTKQLGRNCVDFNAICIATPTALTLETIKEGNRDLMRVMIAGKNGCNHVGSIGTLKKLQNREVCVAFWHKNGSTLLLGGA